MKETDQRKAGGEQLHAQDTAMVGSITAISEIQARLAALPVLDDRSPDEIIGYDEFGLPS